MWISEPALETDLLPFILPALYMLLIHITQNSDKYTNLRQRQNCNHQVKCPAHHQTNQEKLYLQ